MSSTIPSRLDESSDPSAAGAERSEPGGRAQRGAGGGRGRPELAAELKALLPDELLDELLAGAGTEVEISGPGGLLSQLTRRLVERALEVELTDHLGYEPDQEPSGGVGNTRNGSTAKTLLTEHGEVRIETPRDRKGTFEPQIVRKRQRRFEGFDDKILALYSRGLSTREIEAQLEEIYGSRSGDGPQAGLPRDPECGAEMDADPRLDESPTRVQDPLRRPTARLTINPPTQIVGRPRDGSVLSCVLAGRRVRHGRVTCVQPGYLPAAPILRNSPCATVRGVT
jgi:Transposase, Mutator family